MPLESRLYKQALLRFCLCWVFLIDLPSVKAEDKKTVKNSATIAELSSLEGEVPEGFTAKYKFYYKWIKMGEGQYVFSKQPDVLSDNSALYRFAFNSKLRFLFFSDRRQAYSDFTVSNGVIYPQTYYHEREGSGDDYTEQVTFDWDRRLIDARFLKKQYQLDLNSPEKPIQGQAALNSYTTVLDGLAVQFQLFLDIRKHPDHKAYKYPILEPFGLMERTFEFDGIENIELEVNGEDVLLECAVYSVKREQKKFRTLMYFAKDLGYLPVQLVHYTKGKKQFSAILSEFETTAAIEAIEGE